MRSVKMIAIYRLLLSLLAFSALITQFVTRAQVKPFNPVNFFSYFTIESNILVAVILLLSSLGTALFGRSEQFGVLRGAATVYILTTGLIYFLLLRGLEESLQTPIPWVNTVLHYIMPLAMILDWVINPPMKTITWRQATSWLIFPILYVIYSLIRGPFVNWYPYPFLDPRIGGYGKVLLYSIGIAVVIGVICGLVKMLGNRSLSLKQ
ncbi:Pr6Pr family membrane protein [Bacillus hominis]|uniref:Pr6Pr family membrane protein n=1 Tax=Bacillus hominis TaxID=2817478 RepID=A0ABT7R7Z9_9BACI|nr:Pr6Pr family membrane protein [Bacillus hominis]MDM5433635.1 Pr6Pr family membrane protein [Bacillus hominis]MDM5439058.1 Pr6Pr family membrane protein [Bacillus hominis]